MILDLSSAAVRARVGDHTDGLGDDDIVRLDARALWSALTEPGDGIAGALVGAHGARRALELAIGDGVTVDGVAPDDLRAARSRWLPRVAEAVHALSAAQRARVRAVTPEHPLWPRRLDDLGVHAPLCLWVRGDAAAIGLPPRALALVGARAATSYGEHVAADLAADLAGIGVSIVSGAAYGIDGMAHRGALAASGLTTAWLAGGVDRAYPAGHRDLLDRIVAQAGAVVSEVPCGTAPTKWRFLARNRLIAAAADATVVVEAGWRSGSLNTAAHAATLGRALGAVPGPVTSVASAGCHRLLREFDAECVTGADDVRELLGLDRPATLFSDGRTDDLTRVCDALSARVDRDASDLARRTGMSSDEVLAALGLLELEGTVIRGVRGWRAAPRR